MTHPRRPSGPTPPPGGAGLAARLAREAVPRQASFDELGRPLRDITFVVVDLETTGGSPDGAEITEVGAVKVRGGEVLGEFQTLVRPAASIPAFVAVLTGITDTMVAAAPPLRSVLPAFLEFARGSVLVAHNAPFDMSFLRAGCAELGYPWPGFEVVDTVRLARRVLTKDETPDCRLSSLARLFRAETVPVHRALADARATVDVLHGLLGRLGGLGVQSLEELQTFSALVPPEQRGKRYLADGLPSAPGVYLFRDGAERVLYVGTSRDVRRRVRQYFTASEPRTRMAEMVALAERVDAIVCAHGLEAEVRELRLIAEHKPRYNRRSRWPERSLYVKLTVEPFPRLSMVRTVRDDGTTYLGPFGSRRSAERAVAAVHEAVPLRQCGGRLSPRRHHPACALFELGRCGAPCEGRESVEEYARHVAAAVRAMTADATEVVQAVGRRIELLRAQQRYEDASTHRDRLIAFVRAAMRLQRLAALTRIPELVAAAPADGGGWELAAVRHGRLVAASVIPRGAAPRPYIDALRATAETVRPGPGPTPCASAEETECILRWTQRPGVRLVEVDGSWSSPARGAGRLSGWLASVTDPTHPRRPARRRAIPPTAPDRPAARAGSRPAPTDGGPPAGEAARPRDGESHPTTPGRAPDGGPPVGEAGRPDGDGGAGSWEAWLARDGRKTRTVARPARRPRR